MKVLNKNFKFGGTNVTKNNYSCSGVCFFPLCWLFNYTRVRAACMYERRLHLWHFNRMGASST